MRLYSQNPRIVLYSHDTMGLGHLRRNLLIAREFSKSRLEPNILLMTGIPEAARFPKLTGVDCVVLPSLCKDQNSVYRSRRLRMKLKEIIDLRRQILLTSISTFDPDILIVDGVPWGAISELDLTLEHLRERGSTVCILGMRDVWDEPSIIRYEWNQKSNEEAIRKYYSQIWIYGDPTIYDAVHEYSLSPDIVDKVIYTGYLVQRARVDYQLIDKPDHRFFSLNGNDITNTHFALCMMGGGQDGTRLAEAFIDAKLPEGSNGIVVTGPDMDCDIHRQLYKKIQGNKRITIIDFLPEPSILMQYADCIISMGGYNTICEIASFRKRALVVPRVVPRKEQLIRAQKFNERGIIDILHPDDLEAGAITKWLRYNMGRPQAKVHLEMNGLGRVTQLMESVFAETKLAGPNYGPRSD
jgi:predicted glycosyltransferase